MKLSCSSCQHTWVIPEGWTGDEVQCPQCHVVILLPQAQTVKYSETPIPELSPPGRERPTAVKDDQIFETGTLIGQYRVTGFLGRGGMGAVYRAEHTMLQRTAAIKVLPSKYASDPEFVQRFQREAKALANLNHPGIVAIHDMGQQGGLYYFVMEYVEGVNLRELVAAKTMSPEQALHIVPQLCEALEYAHSVGIIHRDIKPENILIDKSGRAKIADFGLAKIVKGESAALPLTHTNVIMGTVEYMAPEQRDNLKRVDHRADIYSLGVVLYEMLTGQLPVGKFDMPSRRVQVDVKIDEVVLKALENNPDHRYQRASVMGTDVRNARSGVGAAAPVAIPSGTGLQIGDAFSEAFQVYTSGKNWLPLAVAGLLYGVLSGISFLILAGPLTGGAMILCLNALRHPERKVQFGDLFGGLNRFGSFFLLFWASLIFYAAGAVVLILPCLYLLVIWMYAYAEMTDRNLGVFEALGASYRRVSREGFWAHAVFAFLILLLNLLVIPVGVFTFSLGFLLLPLGWLAVASAYLRLRAQEGADAAPAPAPVPTAVPAPAAPPDPAKVRRFSWMSVWTVMLSLLTVCGLVATLILNLVEDSAVNRLSLAETENVYRLVMWEIPDLRLGLLVCAFGTLSLALFTFFASMASHGLRRERGVRRGSAAGKFGFVAAIASLFLLATGVNPKFREWQRQAVEQAPVKEEIRGVLSKFRDCMNRRESEGAYELLTSKLKAQIAKDKFSERIRQRNSTLWDQRRKWEMIKPVPERKRAYADSQCFKVRLIREDAGWRIDYDGSLGVGDYDE